MAMENTETATITLQTDMTESLRRILEDQQSRVVAYEEAEAIGDSLIRFYEALAFDSEPATNTP